MKQIGEAFERKRAAKGSVAFQKVQLTDPVVQHIIGLLSKELNVPTDKIIEQLQQKTQQLKSLAEKSPILYETINANAIENELFTLFQRVPITVPTAPKFSPATFYKLVRYIAVESDEFWPLRSFIDRRRLANPEYKFVGDENNDGITTAAAYPSGKFVFNLAFMQKLLDYAHLKGIKPTDKKYTSNGGDIPDEYAYIEFLIMHEFMHFSEDDFYYQRVIPGANNDIINWVGDFRTNYLLVKSGFTQLPVGLYSDHINYDRQSSYIDMYRLVEQEMKKISQDEQNALKSAMDGLSDNHKPGQSEGKTADVDTSKVTEGDIDKNARKIQEQVEKRKDVSPDERKGAEKEGDKDADGRSGNLPGTGRGAGSTVDYSRITPTYNWQTIVKRFIRSGSVKYEETYARPARRGITGLETARQTGAGAIKPADRPMDQVDLKLMFILDCSGSMLSYIGQVFSNAMALLRQPVFARNEVAVMKFSGGAEMYKGNFAKNKARKVTDMTDKKSPYTTTMKQVFSTAEGGGTTFTDKNRQSAETALAQGYNILMITDTDILYGNNKTNTLALISKYPKQVFIVFAARDHYIRWRQETNIATVNISHF